jgi:hypothetical protein
MALRQRPGLTIIFAASEELRKYVDDIGIFLPTPISIPELLTTLQTVMQAAD